MNINRRDGGSTPPPMYSPVDPTPSSQLPTVAGSSRQGGLPRSPNVLVIPPTNPPAELPAYELTPGGLNSPHSPALPSPPGRSSRASSISSNFGAATALPNPYITVQTGPTELTPWYNIDAIDPGDFQLEADRLRKALKSFNTDESALISIISKLDPYRMRALRKCYADRHSRDLLEDIKKKTSGYFEATLMALVRTPLEEDVYALNKAIAGLGTNEKSLDDILLCRTNEDIEVIKMEFQRKYSKNLAKEVREDLSDSVQYFYEQILKAQRPAAWEPVDPVQIQKDVGTIYRVLHIGSLEWNEISNIVCFRNDAQLRALLEEWRNRYRLSLDVSVVKWHRGHFGKAIALLLQRAYNRPACDAVLLEESMAGLGTRDYLLLTRVVRAHWDHQYLEEVKNYYATIFASKTSGKEASLIGRVKGETSGDYKRLLLAVLE